ncbi:hypothetical protein [Nocardia anaemiae]|uniref:hypothetical protein n=1 Tax=Nocardia anaemiae TaxID=263910 RepID=UPI0007C69533|nr:hypothetical protein [Nocardia anaemiae]
MTNAANRIAQQTVELMMDYGQFCIDGGFGDPDAELDLLDQAFAHRPCAGDGTALLVLSPHQNNFEMSITVQVWDGRPPNDRDGWEQVCEARLGVDSDGALSISSPPGYWADPCPVPPGDYLIEVSGRGFVSYGWPGTTTPGDIWRIRLWPDDGGDLLPHRQWDMPGYGIPENVPISETTAADFVDEDWVVLMDSKGSRRIRATDLEAEVARTEWGGEPIPELREHLSTAELARFDRPLAETIAAMDEPTLRRLARRCAVKACELAGIAERPWVASALTALREGRPLPAPFDDMATAFARLDQEEFGPAEDSSRQLVATFGASRRFQTNPFDIGPVHRPHFALSVIEHAMDPDALTAAIAALHTAAVTFGADAPVLLAEIGSEFGSVSRPKQG